MTMQLTAIIERDSNGYVALCPELDIASQSDSIEQAGRICATHWSCSSSQPRRKESASDCTTKCT